MDIGIYRIKEGVLLQNLYGILGSNSFEELFNNSLYMFWI